MVKLTRQEIEAFLDEDLPVKDRFKLESILSFGWVFTLCFAYATVFVVVFVFTSQFYGVEFYVKTEALPANLAEAIPATAEILQIRTFFTVVLMSLSTLAFVFRRGFLMILIISSAYTLNAIMQSWAFFRGLGLDYVAPAGLAVEFAGVVFLITLVVGGGIYWARRGRDIHLDF